MLLAGNIKPIVHQRTITGVDALLVVVKTLRPVYKPHSVQRKAP